MVGTVQSHRTIFFQSAVDWTLSMTLSIVGRLSRPRSDDPSLDIKPQLSIFITKHKNACYIKEQCLVRLLSTVRLHYLCHLFRSRGRY